MPRAVTALAAALLALVGATALALAQGGTTRQAQGARSRRTRSDLPRRPAEPLPARRDLAVRLDPDGPGRGPGTSHQSLPHRLGAHDRPARLERHATTPTPASAGTVGVVPQGLPLPSRDAALGWKLRFESVNYRAKVFLNGVLVGEHEGGYVPFELPATGLARAASTGWSSGSTTAARTPTSRRGCERRTAAPAAAGGTTAGSCARSTCAASSASTSSGAGAPRVARVAQAGVAAIRRTARQPRHGRHARPAAHDRRRRERMSRPDQGRRRREPRSSRTQISCASRACGSPGAPSSTRSASRRSTAARALVRLQPQRRHPRDPRHRRRPAADQRPAGRRCSGRACTRSTPAGARRCDRATASATCARERPGRHAHPLALPAPPAVPRAGGPVGVMVWDEIPVYRPGLQGLRGAGRDATRASPTSRRWSSATRTTRRCSPGASRNELPGRMTEDQQRYIHRAAKLAASGSTRRACARSTSPATRSAPPSDVYHELDALGINSYFGWYPGPSGQTEDRPGLGPFLDQMHEYYPDSALFVTEFGAEANRSGPSTRRAPTSSSATSCATTSRPTTRSAFLNGAIAWILHDFRVRPDWDGGNPKPQPPLNQKGLADDARQQEAGVRRRREALRSRCRPVARRRYLRAPAGRRGRRATRRTRGRARPRRTIDRLGTLTPNRRRPVRRPAPSRAPRTTPSHKSP